MNILKKIFFVMVSIALGSGASIFGMATGKKDMRKCEYTQGECKRGEVCKEKHHGKHHRHHHRHHHKRNRHKGHNKMKDGGKCPAVKTNSSECPGKK